MCIEPQSTLKSGRTWLELAAVALLGLAAVVAPVVVRPPASSGFKDAMFPLIRNAVEHAQVATFVGLAVVGVLAGAFARARTGLIGVASVSLLVVVMIADISADPTSHNLWPLELIVYLFYAIPAFLGACAGRFARNRVARPAVA